MKEPDFDNLAPEEQEIEDALERGDSVSRPATKQEKEELQAIAQYTLARLADKRLNEENTKWLSSKDVWENNV